MWWISLPQVLWMSSMALIMLILGLSNTALSVIYLISSLTVLIYLVLAITKMFILNEHNSYIIDGLYKTGEVVSKSSTKVTPRTLHRLLFLSHAVVWYLFLGCMYSLIFFNVGVLVMGSGADAEMINYAIAMIFVSCVFEEHELTKPTKVMYL